MSNLGGTYQEEENEKDLLNLSTSERTGDWESEVQRQREVVALEEYYWDQASQGTGRALGTYEKSTRCSALACMCADWDAHKRKVPVGSARKNESGPWFPAMYAQQEFNS